MPVLFPEDLRRAQTGRTMVTPWLTCSLRAYVAVRGMNERVQRGLSGMRRDADPVNGVLNAGGRHWGLMKDAKPEGLPGLENATVPL
jgi:hypothetical protein